VKPGWRRFTPLPKLVVPTSPPQGGTSDPGGIAF